MIFVFGSNLAGRHGRGAAREAHKYHGAVMGVGHGRTGNSYAIPTKTAQLETLPLENIRGYIEEFLNYADDNPELVFYTTPIGTGLAGYTVEEIKSIFQHYYEVPSNVLFTASWFKNNG